MSKSNGYSKCLLASCVTSVSKPQSPNAGVAIIISLKNMRFMSAVSFEVREAYILLISHFRINVFDLSESWINFSEIDCAVIYYSTSSHFYTQL